MNLPNGKAGNRREFQVGQVTNERVVNGPGEDERLEEPEGDSLEAVSIPRAGDTLRIQTRAMACQFAIYLDAGCRVQLDQASSALETVHSLEELMTVHRPESPLAKANARAADDNVVLDETLFEVVSLACRIASRTGAAFDPTTGPLVAMWREARETGRVPQDLEIREARDSGGLDDIRLDPRTCSVGFDRRGVEINLGGIGKGFALDRIAVELEQRGINAFLVHGGHSSLLARGQHERLAGWPVGIRNPLFPTRRLATLLLQDRAMSTSGSGVESFRAAGSRYGHILDPRTGWPVENMLSVTVLSETAAEADALSTAFFVRGVEFAQAYCDNWPGVGALLIPPPRRGQTLEPVVCGISDEVLFFESAS